MEVKLSTEAIEDLKKTLRGLYGEDFGSDLTDDEFNHLGDLIMFLFWEGIKMYHEDPKKLE